MLGMSLAVGRAAASYHSAGGRPAYDFVGEGNCKPNRPQWASKVQYDQCRSTCDVAPACIGFDWDSRVTFCRVRFATNADTASPPAGFQAFFGEEGGRLARKAAVGVIRGIEGSHTAGCFQKADAVPFRRFLGQPADDDDGHALVGPLPTILDYYMETKLLSQHARAARHLRVRRHGLLEYSGRKGEMILPSLDAAPLLKVLRKECLSSVTLAVGVNSDSYNRGLGVVVEASPQINETEEHGLGYVFNGLGVQPNRNVVKFHPDYPGGQLRVEGPGGFSDTDVGFTPPSWTASRHALHYLELTLRADGSNEVLLRSAAEGRSWRGSWSHRLFDGRDIPALYAFIDLGGEANKPLIVGHVSLKART